MSAHIHGDKVKVKVKKGCGGFGVLPSWGKCKKPKRGTSLNQLKAICVATRHGERAKTTALTPPREIVAQDSRNRYKSNYLPKKHRPISH
jgi:hypothetical protein